MRGVLKNETETKNTDIVHMAFIHTLQCVDGWLFRLFFRAFSTLKQTWIHIDLFHTGYYLD